MNKAILIGRLTRDPDIKYFQGNTAVANFTLAVDRTFKNKDGEKEADFIPIVVWRKQAELCEKYLSKGSMVAIIGKLQVRNYKANDGSTRYVTEVVADEIQFLNSSSSSNRQDTPYKSASQPDEQFGIPMDGFEEIDLDLPF